MDPQELTDNLHPGPVEIEQYLRGRLTPGHAAAILAHAVCCRECAATLARSAGVRLGDPAPSPGRRGLAGLRS